MSLITTGSALSALRPGIHDWWGLGYERYPEQFSKLFEILKTSMNYERDVNMYGMGLPKIRPEGAASEFDEMGEGYRYDYVPFILSNATRITHQAIINNQYMQMGEEATKELGNGGREAKEIICANVLNRAFSSSQTFADGNQLCYASHSLSGGGTFANVPSVDVDISEAAIEQAVIDIQGYTDDRGKKRRVMPKQLIVHRNDQFEAARILKSDLRVGTADNDLNALKAGGYMPGGVFVYQYLTDSDAWFIQTDCQKGLRLFQREALQFSTKEDFLTDDIMIKFIEQYSVGCTDVMAIYGCQGA